MARAIFNGTVIAESEAFEIVEGNVYFPPDAFRSDLFQDTEQTTFCGWKGTANYYTVAVDGETAETHSLYGLEGEETADLGRACLLTRRLLEQGVRFVTPSAGDATGVFALHLDPADVTTSLRDDAVKWKFRMVYGSVTNKLLIYANFKVT